MSGVREGHVEADGRRMRYVEIGQGAPLVHLSGAPGAAVTAAHELLSRQFRVVVVEMPPDAEPAPGLASTLARGLSKIGVDAFDLLGSSRGAIAALWLALEATDRVRALILESPPAGRDRDLESRLEELPTPTLTVVGTRDDAATAAMARVYKALLPNGHLVFVYDAGAAVGADRPEAFAEVVADFLERHEAFVISRTPTVRWP